MLLTILIIVLTILVLFVLALLIWLLNAHFTAAREDQGRAATIEAIQQQLENLRKSTDTARETLAESLETGQKSLNKNLQFSTETLNKLHKQMGDLHSSSKNMLQLGEEVKKLQKIFSTTSLRGQMGEWSLKTILENILPGEAYALQHGFKNGSRVDALIKMNNYCVPIDAKFPLPSFEKMTAAETEEARLGHRKQFLKDVQSHIDEIAAKYINPEEGTLDFAMMFIPAENVYYETIVKYPNQPQDIMQYCLDKKVIPVSPNLLYAYLMTVVMGLHGLQIEKQAAEIRSNLKKLNSSFAMFINNWDILGKHIKNTYSQYEQGQKNLDRFAMQLEQTQGDSQNSDTTNLKETGAVQ